MSKHNAVALTEQAPNLVIPLVEVPPPIAMAAPIPSPAPQATATPEPPPTAPEPLPATPEEIARMAGMKGKLLASASRNVVLKRGEAGVHAIFFVTASGEKYRVIDKEAVCLKGHGTKS